MFIAISLTGSASAPSDTTDNPHSVSAHYGPGSYSEHVAVARHKRIFPR